MNLAFWESVKGDSQLSSVMNRKQALKSTSVGKARFIIEHCGVTVKHLHSRNPPEASVSSAHNNKPR